MDFASRFLRSFRFSIDSFIHGFCFHSFLTDLLSPLALLAVLRLSAGAPLDSPTESPAGETSGEELETGSPEEALAVALESVLRATKRHKREVSKAFILGGLGGGGY